MSRGSGKPPEAELLRTARDALGVSQQAVAAGTGLSRALVQAVEYGTRRGSDKTVAAIAAFLKVAPGELEAAGRPGAAVVLARKRHSPGDLAERFAALPEADKQLMMAFLATVEQAATERNGGRRPA